MMYELVGLAVAFKSRDVGGSYIAQVCQTFGGAWRRARTKLRERSRVLIACLQPVTQQYVKSPAATVLVWFASGLISLLGGWCYSELGAALPFTGGETVYLERAFGRRTAFLYVWVSALVAR